MAGYLSLIHRKNLGTPIVKSCWRGCYWGSSRICISLALGILGEVEGRGQVGLRIIAGENEHTSDVNLPSSADLPYKIC